MRTYNENEVNEMWQATPLPFKQLLMEVAYITDRLAIKNPSYPVDVFNQAKKVTDATNDLILKALTYKTASTTHAEFRAAIVTVMAQGLRLLQINNHAPAPPRVVPMVTVPKTFLDEQSAFMHGTVPNEEHAQTVICQPLSDKPKATGIFICQQEWQTEYQYTFKPGDKLKVIRYNDLFEIALCQIPGDEIQMDFELPIETLTKFFKPETKQPC